MAKNKYFIYILIALGLYLFFFQLGDRSFRNPDEGRYAEVAREMVLSHNWIEPTLYSVDYLSKPILFYWLLAVSFKVFGMNEFAARFVPALFGFLAVVITYLFTKKVLGKKEAVFSSILLAANIWYLEVSRFLLIDAVFSFFLVAAFYLFYLAITDESKNRIYYTLFYLSISLAFLTKGLAAFATVGVSLLLYLLLTKRLKKTFVEIRLVEGIFIFLIIALPWFVAISIREPEFLKQFFIHEHFARFTSNQFEHQAPFYYYFVALPIMFLPWVLFPSAIGHAFRRVVKDGVCSPDFYLFICAAGTFIFYSISKTKMPTYLLPCIPLLSILLGRGWVSLSETQSEKPTFFSRLSIFFMMVLIALAVWVLASPLVHTSILKKVSLEARPFIFIIAIILVAEGVVAIYFLNRQKWSFLFYSLGFCVILVSTPVTWTMEALNPDYTNQHFAEALKPLLRSGNKVFIYDQPGAFYDFQFYLDYPVKLVGLEGELKLSKDDAEAKEASIKHEDFYNLLSKNERVYCLMRKSDYNEMKPELKNRVRIIRADKRKVLIATATVI